MYHGPMVFINCCTVKTKVVTHSPFVPISAFAIVLPIPGKPP